jgi:uncharacterized YigZ family protein
LPPEDEYLTAKGPGQAESKVRGSRFIATLAPVRTEDAARGFVQGIVRRYHDASHHPFAYRVGLGQDAVARCSDAGEPSGTAGRPILEAIAGSGLTDVVVVVTRYFGGVKLGTGGLARAYRQCAARALNSAESVRKVLAREVCLRFPYELTRNVRKIVAQHQARIVGQEYGEETRLAVAVPESKFDALREALQVVGRGRIVLESG